MPDDEEFLTVAEVAQRLKLNEQTIRNWIDARKLPAYRVGRRVRIRRADFNVLVGGGRQDETAPREELDGQAFWNGELSTEAVLPAPLRAS